MRALDLLALAAVVVTGLTVFARAELMSPRVRSTYVSNFAVRALMDLTAFACVPLGFWIWGGAHVPLEFAGFLVAAAVCSTVMLVSMRVHDGRDTVRAKVVETRREDVSEVRAAVEETVPAAIDAALPAVLKDLAAKPDPYEPH